MKENKPFLIETEGPGYRLPMNAETIIEDGARYLENKRRKAERLPPLPPLQQLKIEIPPKKFYIVDRDQVKAATLEGEQNGKH